MQQTQAEERKKEKNSLVLVRYSFGFVVLSFYLDGNPKLKKKKRKKERKKRKSQQSTL
jgi:hypothetical protein